MKVLFAVSDEKDAQAIIRVYQKEYKEIVTSKTVYYFNAIIKELQKDKTYDRIVISEDVEMFASDNYQAVDKFIFDKMDAISDEATNAEGNDIPIILLGMDRRTKNDPLLVKLFGLGLYNVLIGQDRSLQKVASLMYKPRTKKEAKAYYKVETEKVNYVADNKNGGISESEIQNILSHYKKIGNNIPKCVQSFDSIVSQYSKEQVKLIIQVLPNNVKVILEENSDSYRKIMGIKGKKIAGTSELRKAEYVEKEIDSGSKLTQPVIIPTAVNTSKASSTLKKKQAAKKMEEKIAREKAEEAKRIEEEKIAKQKAEEEARRKEEEEIAKQKAKEEARRKEEERLAKEKAKAEAKRKEEERLAKEKAEAEANKKEEERKAKMKTDEENEVITTPKRGRGRPRKTPVEEVVLEDVPVKRKRGRPRKNAIVEETEKVEENAIKAKSKDLEEDLLAQFDDYEDEVVETPKKSKKIENKNEVDEFDYDSFEDTDENEFEFVSDDDQEDENEFDFESDDDEIEDENQFDFESDDNEIEEDNEIEDENEFDFESDEEENEEDDDFDYSTLDEDDEDIDFDEIEKEMDSNQEDIEADEADDNDEFEDYEFEDDNFDDIEETDSDESDEDEEENVDEEDFSDIEEDDDDFDYDLIDDEEEEQTEETDDFEEDEDDFDLGWDDEEEENEAEAEDLEESEEDDDLLPGINDDDEFEEDTVDEDAEAEDNEFDEDFEDEDDVLPGFDDEFEETDTTEEVNNVEDEAEENEEDEEIVEENSLENTQSIHNGAFKGISNKNYKYDNDLANSIKDLKETEETTSYNVETDNLITSNQKIVAFVGTTKNGTSFIVNNLAEVYANRGIKTAILDLTKNKNSYYIYTNNEDTLREKAQNCLEKLLDGYADGVEVNKNLSVFTSLPGQDASLDDVTGIIKTLLENYSVILLDCDFDTDVRYFRTAQEMYLVQSLDVLTIQPLTAFLRDLKVKEILETNKLRIIINKNIKVNSLTEKVLIGGMSVYNDPSMTYMTELFNKDVIKYATIPFENQVYVKYLEGLVNCDISLKGYSKNFISSLNKLADMVYPTISGKNAKMKFNNYSENKGFENAFSKDTSSILNKMKKKY